MRLRELLEHIKHKSLSIKIKDCDDKLIYDGSIGSYQNWVNKGKYNEKKVIVIVPEDNLLEITIF